MSMKKASIQFSFDEEKLQAINLYMKQKNAVLEKEMDEFFERFYKQFVPVSIRQFINLKNSGHEVSKPNRSDS